MVCTSSEVVTSFTTERGRFRAIDFRVEISVEADVVAADEAVGPMLWTKRFLEAQGYEIKDNVLLLEIYLTPALPAAARLCT